MLYQCVFSCDMQGHRENEKAGFSSAEGERGYCQSTRRAARRVGLPVLVRTSVQTVQTVTPRIPLSLDTRRRLQANPGAALPPPRSRESSLPC